MKEYKNILTLKEELIGKYGSKVLLTNKRVIFMQGSVNLHYKDISLSSIDSVEFSKERSLWILGVGIFVFLSSILLSFVLPDYILSSLGTGAAIMIATIIVFVFFAKKDVIVFARGTKLELKGLDMNFIRDLRDACFRK